MKNLQKGSVAWIIILIVAVVIIGGIYFYFQSGSGQETKNNNMIVSMIELRLESEMLYSQDKSYKNICDSGYINEKVPGLKKVVNTILSNKNSANQSEAGVICTSTDSNWSISLPLLGENSWCKRDSTLEGVGVKYCKNGKSTWVVEDVGTVGLR